MATQDKERKFLQRSIEYKEALLEGADNEALVKLANDVRALKDDWYESKNEILRSK